MGERRNAIPDFQPVRVFRQVWIGHALRNDSFKVTLAGEPEQTFAISFDVVTVEETFACFGHNSAKPKLAVNQREIPNILAVAEPAHLFLIIRLRVFVPENVECIEERFGTTEHEISELRSAMGVETDDLTIQNTAAAL